ncbi:MAG: glycosyltransferase [Bacteroidia bacterium]|nr:glycosyltransferase [Bacteroidia bacterium]
MRILYCSDEFGGVTTTFIRNELMGLELTDSLAYHCLKSPVHSYLDGKIKIYRSEWKQNLFIRKWDYLLWKNDISLRLHNKYFSKSFQKCVAEFDPEIIHCHFAFEGLRILNAIDILTIPVVLHFHGYDATQMMKYNCYVNELKKWSEHPKVYAICCCKALQDRLNEHGVKFRSRVIFYGIDTDLFTPGIRLAQNPYFTLLQISSFSEKKGHEYTIRAFKSTPPHYRLVLAGDGPEKDNMERLVAELDLNSRVTFPGIVDPLQAKVLYNSADAFVHHSVTAANGDQEGMPNALIEAMAMGLPVISTFHSGIPELVENGVNGILVEERNITGLSEAMKKIGELRCREKNRNKILNHFDRTIHNRNVREYYSQILDNE